MTKTTRQDVIRASEVGEYVYCARSWWLRRVQGVESHNLAAMQRGQAAHDRHGRAVSAYQNQRRLALLLAGMALLAGLIALALAGGGL